MSVVLVRHGQTDVNAQGRFLSRSDPPLNEIGRAQASKLASAIAALDAPTIFASPMRRCVETAQLAAPYLQPVLCEELREVDFGQWESLTTEEVEARYPGELDRRGQSPVEYRPPGGESFADVARRLGALLAELHKERCAVIVSHRGTLGVLERLIRGLALGDRSVVPLEPAQMRVLDVIVWPSHGRPSSSSKTSDQ